MKTRSDILWASPRVYLLHLTRILELLKVPEEDPKVDTILEAPTSLTPHILLSSCLAGAPEMGHLRDKNDCRGCTPGLSAESEEVVWRLTACYPDTQ